MWPALTHETKKLKLKKKLKFSATVDTDSTLVARGKAIKETTEQLAATQETKVKATLKRKARKQIEEKLEKTGTEASGAPDRSS